MEPVSEDANSWCNTPNSEAPNTEAEKRAVECFAALQRHDDAGKEFGQAMIQLREEIKSSGDRDFMTRLKQLGITYETARYWINKVEGKPNDRHKEAAPKEQSRPAFDWDAATARLEDLKDDIYMLKQEKPQGSDALIEPLRGLAGVLGCEVTRGGDNV